MKLGFVSAILPEYTLEQSLSFAQRGGSRASSSCAGRPASPIAATPGVTHLDVDRPLGGLRRGGSRVARTPTRSRSPAWATTPIRFRPIAPRPSWPTRTCAR